MISRLAFGYFVSRGGEDGAAGVTFDGLLDTVNRLWINTLQFSLRQN